MILTNLVGMMSFGAQFKNTEWLDGDAIIKGKKKKKLILKGLNHVELIRKVIQQDPTFLTNWSAVKCIIPIIS